MVLCFSLASPYLACPFLDHGFFLVFPFLALCVLEGVEQVLPREQVILVAGFEVRLTWRMTLTWMTTLIVTVKVITIVTETKTWPEIWSMTVRLILRQILMHC